MAASKVTLLSREQADLTATPAGTPPGTLTVLGPTDGYRVEPGVDFAVSFGRNHKEVHICVAPTDRNVSRVQGRIAPGPGGWCLHNLGRSPIRMPGSRLVLTGGSAALPPAYTPLFIVSPRREHLLEVRVTGWLTADDGTGIGESGTDYTPYPVGEDERLVLVCLAQRHLRGEPYAQPLAWKALAEELARLRPGENWNAHRAANVVGRVRRRLATEYGVGGLLEGEVPPPVGNALNDNLIEALVRNGTIAPDHLALLDEPERP